MDAQIGMGEALLKQDEPNQALDYLLSSRSPGSCERNGPYQLALLYRKLGRGSDSQLCRELRESRKRVEELYRKIHLAPAIVLPPLSNRFFSC